MKKGSIKSRTEDAGRAWLAEFKKLVPRRKRGPLESNLLKVLNAASGERTVHTFLKKHDYLIGMTFRSNTHPSGVVSEFELGTEFRCDFLVLSCCSAWWSVDFVELESPNARLYLKDGTPSKCLRIATRQIRDWKQWARLNEAYLRNRLSSLFGKIGLAASGASPGVADAATEIRDPQCALTSHFYIVIGRRQTLSSAEQQARVQDSLNTGVTIATYDRLVEAASRFDKADTWGKESFKHWKG
jgi:hypothetical protein